MGLYYPFENIFLQVAFDKKIETWTRIKSNLETKEHQAFLKKSDTLRYYNDDCLYTIGIERFQQLITFFFNFLDAGINKFLISVILFKKVTLHDYFFFVYFGFGVEREYV